MTREEEIKARLDEADHVEYQKFGYEYCSEGGLDSFGDAEDDICYLLARNEELQSRVEKMERVVQIIRDNPFTFSKWLDRDLAVKLGKAMLELDAADTEEK